MTSIPALFESVCSNIPAKHLLLDPLFAGNMEAQLQAQIPGLDHIISEYSVVRLSAKKPAGWKLTN